MGSSVATNDGDPSMSGTRNLSSQSLTIAIENIKKTQVDATGNRLRLKDGERLQVGGSTPLGGFAREVTACLGYVDPKHETRKLIQRITMGTLTATEAWTDGRRAEDDKYVELDYELAVALANATEGAARSTVHEAVERTERTGSVASWKRSS